jgi:hypothetical protein
MATAHLSVFLRRLTRGMVAETLVDRSDRQLVEQFLARREEAVFTALVRRHGPMVYRVCWRVLQQEQDAEDAFQAAFLVLAQKLHTVRKQDSLASSLHGVAHRVALNAKAQATLRRRHEQQASVSHPVPPDEVTWRELGTFMNSPANSSHNDSPSMKLTSNPVSQTCLLCHGLTFPSRSNSFILATAAGSG